MSDRPSFLRLNRISTSGVMFFAFLMIVGALLLIANGPTQDASIRPTAAVTQVATSAGTAAATSGS